jgi:arylformamidase
MPIYDISLPISESSVVWPGDPPVRLTKLKSIEEGGSSTVTRLDMSAHTGTHVDAPCHFVLGAPGVDTLDLDVLVGPARVVQAMGVDALSADVLDDLGIPVGTERVLFRTRNSEFWARGERTFERNFVAVTKDGGQWLIDRGARLVGVDYLSVAPFGNTGPTHRLFLSVGTILLEGLNLSAVAPGEYQLYCLPLKIAGGDGAPARAILIG